MIAQEIEMFKYWKINSPIEKTIKMASYFDTGINEGEFSSLVSFFPDGKDLDIKTIQKRAGYSYERMHHYLKSLADRKIIVEGRKGNALVYSINTDNWYAKLAHYHYSSLKAIKFFREHTKIKLGIGQIPQDKIDILIVFGSYSKGTQKSSSDIDVMIVTHYKKNIESSIRNIKNMYGLDLQAVIMKREEFGKIRNENKVLWESLVKDGIIIKGSDLLYYYAYRT